VVAHRRKTLGGGLDELRRLITDEGVDELVWHEVPKSRKAPKRVRKALATKPDLLLVWGGDGMVRRCIDAVGDAKVAVGILPAGTSNLFATNLKIKQDLEEAVRVALRGERRKIDVGRFNGERFATMAGAGFDAAMIRDADSLKERLGRAAYVLSGARNLNVEAFGAKIRVDGTPWYDGPASCILFGNVGNLFGGIEVFADASLDDGMLDLGVVTADGPVKLGRTVARTAVGDPQKSPFVRVTKARKVKVQLDRKVRYELDGGDRSSVTNFKVRVEPSAVTVCVPRAD
jgi:YegS/Rv2252/BmrU family lipid kinase